MAAYYEQSIDQFILDSSEKILGTLAEKIAENFHQQFGAGTISWKSEISILKLQLDKSPYLKKWGHIFIEYPIPRRQKRIDAVLLVKDIIIVIEYKQNTDKYNQADIIQVEDYCLDLRDFHQESRNKIIIPILLSENADNKINDLTKIDRYLVATQFANKDNLSDLLSDICKKYVQESAAEINSNEWNCSQYLPTPTIIEAAQTLFAGHNVKEITRSHAGIENLTTTTNILLDVIKKSKENKKKTICFVTGVPGSGKTLVGLNIVHTPSLYKDGKYLASYFSGNGPLVEVLREALARDKRDRESIRINDARREVSTLIENLHVFIQEGLRNPNKPIDKIVVFDEAQRAWTADHFYNKTSRNMNRKPDSVLLKQSEPELLLKIMDRNEWAIIIALVGGGQEINTGEAGIEEWGRVLKEKYAHWEIYMSPKLNEDTENTADKKLFQNIPIDLHINECEALHLKTNIRAHRANSLNTWVECLLNNDSSKAHNIYEALKFDYPIKLTRSLEEARNWLMDQKKGSRRAGLAASSGAIRIKPYGLNVKEEIDVPKWFLNGDDDIRASQYLELPVTEFAIQGLEIDIIGVCWGADFRKDSTGWLYKQFKGCRWNNVNIPLQKQYILNKYRVLLTRARDGLIIWVPQGKKDDPTRVPEFYDNTTNYLKECGIEEI